MPSVNLSLQTAVAVAAALLLAACEPKPPVPKAALTTALPVAEAVTAVTAAVIMQDEPVPIPPVPALTAASVQEPLSGLQEFVGKYPYDDVNYLEQGVLAARLRALLGDRYPELLANMRTVSPLTEADGLWFITGNRPHEGGSEVAAVVIDPRQNALRVWLLNAGKSAEFVDPPLARIPWPKDVQTLLSNQNRPQ
ncbi:hypothetical protein N0K08_00895 [Acidovorax sp. Be4]|uniref:Lipoprotein n=1 Tax=Acidovorax bellezanensis TaxID=2976702 RepID=A0ABT2PGB1_9BURK|nr:hypothetical protein [Acidovorax sp. Be4]MCT9809178.1 hypothetical protein [Acidovorax sp. Be4]